MCQTTWRKLKGVGRKKKIQRNANSCFFFFFTTWGLPVDQQGSDPPPAVCPRRQERRSTNWAAVVVSCCQTPGLCCSLAAMVANDFLVNQQAWSSRGSVLSHTCWMMKRSLMRWDMKRSLMRWDMIRELPHFLILRDPRLGGSWVSASALLLHSPQMDCVKVHTRSLLQPSLSTALYVSYN